MNDKLRAKEIKTYFGDKPFNSTDLYNFYASYEPDLKKTTFRWRVYTLKNNGVINTLKKGVYSTTSKKDLVGFEIPFTSGKVMYSYQGFIKAGIDFNDIEVTTNEAKKTIFIELPEAEILSSEVDFDSLIVYDEKYTPFNVFTFSDMNLGLTALKEKAEESAITNGLLIRAAENAQSILRTTVMNFYDLTEYKVDFY